ncbi:MAG: hypothetical protein HYY48_11410 [Gammaproteobacteria bacterium]|nr:hypothetical protein [Gammaproteobacteria bacterium]
MMITRRGFLRTTLVTVGMQAATPAHGSMRSFLVPPIHVIAVAGCGAGEAFCDALSLRAQRFSFDVGEVLQDLEAGHGAEPGSICLGLTRDSDHLLIRQILIERGSAEIYAGTHEIAHDGWRHLLHAPKAVIEPLSAAIIAPGTDWAGAIAAHASGIAAGTGRRTKRTLISPHSRVPAGPTCLVSWAYRVGAAPA